MTTISASGITLPDLFKDSAHRLLALLTDPTEVGQAIREKIVLDAPDLSALLREWITALLSLASQQRILVSDVRFLEFKAEKADYSLKAEATGELIDPLRHTFTARPDGLRLESLTLTSPSSPFAATLTLSRL